MERAKSCKVINKGLRIQRVVGEGLGTGRTPVRTRTQQRVVRDEKKWLGPLQRPAKAVTPRDVVGG